MKLPLFIARRYFFTRRKKSFIQFLTLISVVGVAVGTAALIIVLSVFNGLEDLIRTAYNTFDPELKITPAQGKSFEITDSLRQVVEQAEGVEVVTEVIEDNALVKFRNAQTVVKLKGVSESFLRQSKLSRGLVNGELKLKDDKRPYAIIGRGIQYVLSIPPDNDFYAMQVFYPKRLQRRGSLNPGGSFVNRRNIMPAGIFAVEQQYDASYVIVPLSFAEQLMDYQDRRTSLEVKSAGNFSTGQVQEALQQVLGTSFQVLNSDQQHASLLRAIKVEKLFVYLTFSFILAVASFNIFFCLSMLAIDKQKDMSVLFTMGATHRAIRSIFLQEGAIIAFSGAALGLIGGFIVCFLQQEYGLVSMGMQTAIVDAYPVQMQFPDFLFTALSIILITVVASFRPAVLAARVDIKEYI